MSRLPRVRRRPALLGVVVALLLALVGSSLAQASALTLTTRLKPFTTSQSRCTSQSVAVTNPATAGTTSSVVVSTVDAAACAGKPIVVTVYDPAVTTLPAAIKLQASGTVTTATATLTAATGSFTPKAALKVHVTIGGWQVPATWTYSPPLPLFTCTTPDSPAVGCTATVSGGTVWGNPASDYLGTVTISTTSRTAVRWQLMINLSDTTTIPFVTKALADVQGGLVLVGTSGCTAYPRTVTVVGTTAWGNYNTVVAGRTSQMQLHGYSTPQPGAMLINCP